MNAPDMYDVVIAGGGPVGSTVSTLIKKYNPALSVLVLEKLRHPREHVGESLLPGVCGVLHEMGCWDKMEAQNFPIKIGASLTWGKMGDKWEFDFYPAEEFVDQPRPAKYEGQRQATAFQVERDRYDEILFRHAAELGAECREEVGVDEVLIDPGNPDRIDGLKLSTGEIVRGKHYVDGTGNVALLRRALGVESESPKLLRNVAFWDYWDNAKWKVEIGVGATRVLVRSLPYGWIWFIPLGPTRASCGLICPSDHYKDQSVPPHELYHRAISEEPEIRELLADATCDGKKEKVYTTKNWSHLATRLVGENWWLAGETAGFADPILAAGLTLTHNSAREVAYSILEIERGELDAAWLKRRYDEKLRRNINQHIRFAEYWYATNGCFTDLQEHCKAIAKDAGLRLGPNQAWRWLAQGGFANEDTGRASLGSFDLGASKAIIERFLGKGQDLQITKANIFELNLRNAEEDFIGELENGRITRVPCYKRGTSFLPVSGRYKAIVQILGQHSDIRDIVAVIEREVKAQVMPAMVPGQVFSFLQALEAMVLDGWVLTKNDKKRPRLRFQAIGGRLIRSEADAHKALEEAKGSIKFA
ncbi:MAG: tryptophan 7-halogenase [Phycisphaeraceae bacterium]|nr:MAG: tryptophan 7-halogenase [Phycisphaeraceae bacterium]